MLHPQDLFILELKVCTFVHLRPIPFPQPPSLEDRMAPSLAHEYLVIFLKLFILYWGIAD